MTRKLLKKLENTVAAITVIIDMSGRAYVEWVFVVCGKQEVSMTLTDISLKKNPMNHQELSELMQITKGL